MLLTDVHDLLSGENIVAILIVQFKKHLAVAAFCEGLLFYFVYCKSRTLQCLRINMGPWCVCSSGSHGFHQNTIVSHYGTLGGSILQTDAYF